MNPILFQPELYGLFMSGVFLSLSLVRPNPNRDFFTALALSAVGILVCLAGLRLEGGLFYGAYRVDLFSQVFKTLLFMGLFLVICICSELKGISERLHSEFYLLLSVCTLAMMMLVSSVHLLTIYMALELSSYSLYILVFLRKREDYGIDAGIKYFLIGAAASAVMLFGFALLYGATQAAYVGEMLQVLPGLLDRPLVIIGLFLTLSGFLFKLAVFPFHFWAPDVYEGAPNQVTAYIASASKVGAIAILIRMVSLTGGDSEFLAHALVALAIITMTVGNLAAIVQKDLKRLLAYSSVAQAGYILIGILSMNAAGYTGAIFYALALLLMKFTAFLVVVKVAYDGKNISVDQLAGLHRRSPLLAMALMLSLFGLAGIPPTIGFTGKLLLFTAAMKQGYFTLVLIAMINVVISLYYYLLVIKAAYLTAPVGEQPDLEITPPMKLLTGTLVTVMVVVGIYPTWFLDLAAAAARMLVM
ncbi:MAG: NADH-quinone oxidoreductase subunit N [Thermodesulfobacteriota bacterium]